MKKDYIEQASLIITTFTWKERIKRFLKGKGIDKKHVWVNPPAIHMQKPLLEKAVHEQILGNDRLPIRKIPPNTCSNSDHSPSSIKTQ